MDMIRLLELIARTGSIWAAKEIYSSHKENKEKVLKKFSKRINEIRALNINPVTIADDSEIELLEGLQGKIDTYFDNSLVSLKES